MPMNALVVLAACGTSVFAHELGSRSYPSLRAPTARRVARVGASRSSLLENDDKKGEKDEPPTIMELLTNATEGKTVKVVEEALTRLDLMPSQDNCNNFFMSWQVEGHSGGHEQGFCEINDLLMPFVAFFFFAVQFTIWFAVCRKRKRSVKGPYKDNDTTMIQALDVEYFLPWKFVMRCGSGSNSTLVFETMWWWFMCIDDCRGPMASVKALGNVLESLLCFCWMHADTMTRSGLSSNLNAYGTGCLTCMGPCPCFPCCWASSYLRMKTRKELIQKIHSSHVPEFNGACDYLLHCCLAPFAVRQEAELVENNRHFEANPNGPPAGGSLSNALPPPPVGGAPGQQGMTIAQIEAQKGQHKGKAGKKGKGKG